MLGPIVALLLLTAPSAPIDQLCLSFDAESRAACQVQSQQQQLQRQIDDQQRRIDTLERQQQSVPPLTLPSLYPDSSSTTRTRCALC